MRDDGAGAAGRGGAVVATGADRLLGEPAEELRGVGDLRAGVGAGLAVLVDDKFGQLVLVAHHQVKRAVQQVGALAVRGETPARQRGVCSLHRGRRVGGVAVGYLGDDGAVGRVLDVEDAGTAGPEGAADEHATGRVEGVEVGPHGYRPL